MRSRISGCIVTGIATAVATSTAVAGARTSAATKTVRRVSRTVSVRHGVEITTVAACIATCIIAAARQVVQVRIVAIYGTASCTCANAGAKTIGGTGAVTYRNRSK